MSTLPTRRALSSVRAKQDEQWSTSRSLSRKGELSPTSAVQSLALRFRPSGRHHRHRIVFGLSMDSCRSLSVCGGNSPQSSAHRSAFFGIKKVNRTGAVQTIPLLTEERVDAGRSLLSFLHHPGNQANSLSERAKLLHGHI